MRVLAIIIILLISPNLMAELYKWTDKDGNVIYSDKPNPAGPSEKIKGKPLTSYAPPKLKFKPSPKPKETEKTRRAIYTEFSITEPANDAGIRVNSGDVPIKFKVTPSPSNIRGHRIDIYLDGKKSGSTVGTSYTLKSMDRGTHTVRADIVDGGGKALKSTTVTFHLLRASVGR